ncbi:MAG: topoisomerase DNA-binding C4 zinc finger domain-containing protein [Thalassotalea sp.]
MSDSDQPLFKKHEHALEKTHEVCPECESGLTIKHSKAGAFWGCQSYPSCSYTRPVVEQQKVEDKPLPGSSCPECGNELAVKQGRYGMFIGCSNFPECHHIEDSNHQPLANNTDVPVDCPSCNKGQLQEKTSRFGKIFYSCDQYPKCKYVINFQPVAEACPQCQWPIMLKRQMASGEVHVCPQKKCGCKIKITE